MIKVPGMYILKRQNKVFLVFFFGIWYFWYFWHCWPHVPILFFLEIIINNVQVQVLTCTWLWLLKRMQGSGKKSCFRRLFVVIILTTPFSLLFLPDISSINSNEFSHPLLNDMSNYKKKPLATNYINLLAFYLIYTMGTLAVTIMLSGGNLFSLRGLYTDRMRSVCNLYLV